MATIIIGDEGARRAVIYALWSTAARGPGDETLHDDLLDAARAVYEADPPEGLNPRERITRLMAIADGVSAVYEAPIGSSVELDVPASGLATGLGSCAISIKESEDAFWDTSEAVRARMLATHDAAVRLRAGLAEPAAVA